jgi:hypothetical protein
MLDGVRARFLLSLASLSFLLAFSATASLPVQAQVNGVPASVTSLGFGGNYINGVRSSVTSLGPAGYVNNRPLLGDCCANLFMPANPYPPLFNEHHRHRKNNGSDKDHHNRDLAVVGEPVYIPYAAPDAEQEDDESADRGSLDNYAQNVGPLNAPLVRHAGNRSSVANGDAAGQSDKPVAQQPPTVLVFKDGHRTEVFNYAVVGDTLFDFAADRTHKIQLADLDLSATQKVNEERGVDFQIPADAAQ